jgi:hypothetical protein
MFSSLVVAIAAMVNPVADEDRIISELNSPKWEVRTMAFDKAVKAGHLMIERLETEAKNNKNLEVRSRCKLIIKRFYQDFEDDKVVPEIWCLPKERRAVGGKDVAKGYFEEEANIEALELKYHDIETAIKASKTFLREIARREGKDAALKLMKQMNELEVERNTKFPYYTMNYADRFGGYRPKLEAPPLPVEDIINPPPANAENEDPG